MSTEFALPAYSMNRASFPWMYERSLVEPLFLPWAESLLDRVELVPTTRVLDVACGTGIVARLAHRRGAGVVVGVDVSAPMLEVAREIEPDVDWRQGDAAALPIGPEQRFDVVLCQQGVQFFADRAAAAREMRRALAPGGTLLVSVWRPADEVPLFLELQRVAERYLGPIHDQRYAFGAAHTLEKLLKDSGSTAVEVDVQAIRHRFPDGEEFVRMNTMALVGMSGACLAEAERERMLEEIARESVEASHPFADGAALVCEMRATVAVARAT